MKALLLGNGFECMYNENVRNFNDKFKKLVNDKEQIKIIISEILKFCKDTLKSTYELIFNEIKNQIVFWNEDFNLEEQLHEIGEYLNNNPNENSFGQRIDYYHAIKNIVGYVIHSWTYNANKNLSKKITINSWQEVDALLTTNYTESTKDLAKLWESTINSHNKVLSRNEYSINKTKKEIVVFYLHGKFNYYNENQNNLDNYWESSSYSFFNTNKKNKLLSDSTFKNIEINLENKDESILRNFLENTLNSFAWNRTQSSLPFLSNHFIDFEIFGLSINNDNEIFNLIFSSLLSGSIKTITYYFYTSEDEKKFLEFKQRFLQANKQSEKISEKIMCKNAKTMRTFVL